MDPELNRKITEALRLACRPDDSPIIHLEERGTGRVGGSVVSTKFVRMTPSARQDAIWEQLDAALSPPERSRITFIVAETREEHEALAELGS
ncbi:MAG: hypothetical protein FJZ01_25325 [Candidatus Sericytochromatia bacterium]|nr:hypothetical protein [Candidatus Tanganyikabacteria bacterium]